eukprot:TRINITY_DN5532_c0_g1_i1.p1 TRINITY_DN5532_c0_g1~~TRINITY_DN5532_c0_g1_i1.p1  ORF type:complete len:677 (-),score=188.95 TRINITY_DN5532_c0_g1_i1:104-2134(-)
MEEARQVQPPPQRCSKSMFHGRLALLAADYTRLEIENSYLKRRLADFEESEACGAQEEASSEVVPREEEPAQSSIARYVPTTPVGSTGQGEGEDEEDEDKEETAGGVHDGEEMIAPPPTKKSFRSEAAHQAVFAGPSDKMGSIRASLTLQEADELNRRAVFLTPGDMQEQVRRNFHKETAYTANAHYKENGVCQAIVRHPVFDSFAMCCIALNSIWIAIDTDYNDSLFLLDAHPVFMAGEQIFCFVFFTELMIRLAAFESWKAAFTDTWFVFDSVLVLLMVLEAWVLTMATLIVSAGGPSKNTILGKASVLRVGKSLRLLRIARMARLLRMLPELMTLIKGMASGMRSVVVTLLLLTMITYVFAIAFTQTLYGSAVGDEHFKNVITSMQTLWVNGALLDGINALMLELRGENVFCVLLLNLFTILSALFVMNMLIGVLCNVVICVGTADKEEFLMGYTRTLLKRVFPKESEKATMNKQDFVKALRKDSTQAILADLGVDSAGLAEYADVMFTETNPEVSFQDFMEMILQLNGSRDMHIRDLVNLRKFFALDNAKQREALETKLDVKFEKMNIQNSMLLLKFEDFVEKAAELSTNAQKDIHKEVKKDVLSMSSSINQHLAIMSDVLYSHPEVRPPIPYEGTEMSSSMYFHMDEELARENFLQSLDAMRTAPSRSIST